MPELTLLIDSKPGRNRSADGSAFEYPLEAALMVPFDAEPKLRVLEANAFYTSANVSAAKSNNKLKFSVITSGTVAGGNVSTTDHITTFDDGLCSLADLKAELADYLEPTTAIADAALSFVGHGPTQTAIADWDAEAATYGAILRFMREIETSSLTPHCNATACRACSRWPRAYASGVQWFVCCVVCSVPLCPVVSAVSR